MTDQPEPAPDRLREQMHAAIEREIYNYREQTPLWGETEGVTEAITRLATRAAMDVRDQETEQLRAELDRARTELAQHAENESADAAASSYASSSEHAIAHPEPWLHILFTSPDATTANTSALNLRDHLTAEFDGVSMRITSNAVEAATGCSPAAEETQPDNPELTAEEARDLADELSTDLYKAQDALAFVEECCVIADREQRNITTADVRTWLKGAQCGRQLAADGGIVVDPSAPPLEFVTWSGPVNNAEQSPQTTPDNSPTSENTPDNPAATEATDTRKQPAHPHPCTATIEGRATPGGRQVQCTREARHPENHVGPKQGANGKVLWTDRQSGATPHKEQP